MSNPNCDGAGPHFPGEVRLLPLGAGGNLILCFKCHQKELEFRRERNRELEDQNRFNLPQWNELEVYDTKGE